MEKTKNNDWEYVVDEETENYNRNHKSGVFISLFQTCKYAKKNALSLMNSLHGTDYTDESLVNHIDLESSVYMGLRNDVSFTFDDKLIVLMEHQSTVNNNMPLRTLMYIARLYERMTDRKSRYRKKLVRIPTPEIYVFYNGKEKMPSEYTMKLSDAFMELDKEISLDLVVKVININPRSRGGSEILDKCNVLREYSEMMEIFKEYIDSGNSSPARETIQRCMKEGILVEYLMEEGDEVENWLFAEYDRDEDIAVQREEAAEDAVERINLLIQKLLADNRQEDLKKSSNDREYQIQLMKEYGIID